MDAAAVIRSPMLRLRLPVIAEITAMRRMGLPVNVLMSVGLVASGGLFAVAQPPETAQTPTYSNPVYRHNAPDPSVIRADDGTFYAFTTQAVYGEEKVNIPILQSTDLIEWTLIGDAFPTLPEWALTGEDADTWAPHVIRHRSKYYMYFSARRASTRALAIGVATADEPTGPWRARRRPLISGPRFTTIDPFVLQTSTGRLWLYWGSGGEPIRAQRLSPDGFSLTDEPTSVMAPSSRPYESLIEAAWIVHRKDYYYLFYSGDRCCYAKAHYAVLVARSRSRLGPFKRFAGNPIVAANETFDAPGHIATIPDSTGRCWMLYHAMAAGEESGLRYLMLDPIEWRRGWPRINSNSPSSDPVAAPDLSGDVPEAC